MGFFRKSAFVCNLSYYMQIIKHKIISFFITEIYKDYHCERICKFFDVKIETWIKLILLT